MKAYDLFTRKFIPPKALGDALTENFGTEWHDWEPETLLQEIRRVWGVTPVSEVRDKIFALQTFINTKLFWDDPLAFEKIILAFSDRHVDPDLIQSCLPEEIAYGMRKANELRLRRDFVLDVIEYIRACHKEAGVLVYHPEVAFAQPVYEDEFRQNVAKFVTRALERDQRPPTQIDQSNPIEVQHAKSWDVNAFVEEREDREKEAML